MNILFLTMSNFRSFKEHGIYEDLMREFVRNNHNVFVVAPAEKRNNEKTACIKESDNATVLRVGSGNLQKSSLIKKGIATLRLPFQFTKEIKKHFNGCKFDLIIYSTPPVTLYKTIKYFKRRDKSKTFLLLKDIFPQNALDIGILKKKGLKGIIYKHFRRQEKGLYAISDHIGCMSEANKQYILKHNPSISEEKVCIVPNSIELQDFLLATEERVAMRNKYEIPQDKKIFIYGGNLGKPQDIPFVIDCLKSQKNNADVFFLIVGDGTEFVKLQNYVETEQPQNVKLLKRLPREDFDRMLAACDIGMIFLDHRFTIPNYPSRLLSYMQAGLPVLACTDSNTDVGKDIAENGFGWWSESDDVNKFAECVQQICNGFSDEKGKAAISYLNKNFTVSDGYKKIMNCIGANE